MATEPDASEFYDNSMVGNDESNIISREDTMVEHSVVVNEEVNEEWISDKSRHAFDGLKKQRLSVPMSRKPDGTYAELNWQEAMAIAAEKLSSIPGE